jgi:hypothetical protein
VPLPSCANRYPPSFTIPLRGRSIDNSPIEEALVAQLLADESLLALVDEFYFEVRNCHIRTPSA